MFVNVGLARVRDFSASKSAQQLKRECSKADKWYSMFQLGAVIRHGFLRALPLFEKLKQLKQ